MTDISKKHVLVLTDSSERSRTLIPLLGDYNVTLGIISEQPPTQDNLIFRLGDYDSLIHVFQLALKRQGVIDQVIGFFPEGLQDTEQDVDKLPVSNLSLVSVWITKLATFYFRQSGRLNGSQGIVLVAPAPASKDNESSPLQAIGTNSLLGLMRSVQHQAFFEGYRFSLVYSTRSDSEAEEHETATAVLSAISQEDKFTLESNSKVFLSTGHIIRSHETTMAGVEGYRKLGNRLVGIVALKCGIRSNSQKAARLLRTAGLSRQPVQSGLSVIAVITFSWLAWRGWIPSVAYMLFGGLLWRSLTASQQKSKRPPRTRKDGETCSTAVFLGSGGHTGEAIQLLSALDPARYTPRTYIFCTGDNMSVTKATNFEKGLADKSLVSGVVSGDEKLEIPYRLVELPRARKVAQSYVSSVFTAVYSLLVTLWKLALEPILRGKGKSVPDLLIVNGPGTCVVVVLVYRLLRLLGQRSPEIIYVESFARVTSLSLSGKILKNVVDKFIVQWPIEDVTGGQNNPASDGSTNKVVDTKLQYHGWLI